MKNKKRQYKGGKMTTRQTFTAFLINNNECMHFGRLRKTGVLILLDRDCTKKTRVLYFQGIFRVKITLMKKSSNRKIS